jgi:tRNA 2-selenouridine synthase
MQEANVVDIVLPFDDRVEFLVKEYGVLDKEFLRQSLLGISKRLGPMQTKEALIALDEDRMHDFIRWALEYYDKQYRKSLERRDVTTVTSIEFEAMDIPKIAKHLLQLKIA